MKNNNMIDNSYLEKAKYYIFPNNGKYVNFNEFPENLIKFPIIEDSMYGTYCLNNHHFKPFYHIQYVLPMLLNSLNIQYDINDFNIVENFDGDADVSYLEPKKEFNFDLHDLISDEKLENVDFSYLRKCNINDGSLTEYHKLFCFPHRCGHIVNKTIDSNKTMVISCDSQMIPIVPILACYFKEIYHLDNRQYKEVSKNIDFSKITYIIIVGGFNNERKYLKDNFR